LGASLLTQYRNALETARAAKAAVEQLRQRIIDKGCPNPGDFVLPWHTTIYQVDSFCNIGIRCTICEARTPRFGSGWMTADEAEVANREGCTHPQEWHHEYKWHHGYGKYITGIECGFCQAKKSFPSQGDWWSKKAQDEQAERDRYRDD
jgi:hypothetical protein